MYLAAHLGHPSPTRMLEEMSALDLALWSQYVQLHPFGELREDARHGIRSALFVQANSKKGTKTKPSDFYPKFSEGKSARKPMSVAHQLAYVQYLNVVYNKAFKGEKVN